MPGDPESVAHEISLRGFEVASIEPGDLAAIDFEITSPGWTWFYSGSFGMLADRSHEDLYSADGVYFLRDPAIASQDCEETEEPGVGTSVDDLVAWLDASPGLSASEPVPVTVGGLEGMRLDIEHNGTAVLLRAHPGS